MHFGSLISAWWWSITKTSILFWLANSRASNDEVPKCKALVNPNQLDDKSNLGYLCAAGVSFLFIVPKATKSK